jgi:beta-mannosidase
MLAHQKHPRGNQLIREYMLREYPEPKDFDSFLYVSQVLQAEGIRVGAEHLRRTMPHNMGSLYWQLDDCWPVASWSSIDYFGRWKALQYYARRFYDDLLVSPHLENNNVELYVVSDRTQATPAELSVALRDFDGHALSENRRSVEVAALASKSYLSLAADELLRGHDARTVFLDCELRVGGQVVSSNRLFFRPFKELQLPSPHVTTAAARTRGGFTVTLKSDRVARAVYLSAEGLDGAFSDNYFDLIPGKEVKVEFRARRPPAPAEFRAKLKARTLADAFR